ncbi:MAG: AMP-binding protein [Planctomycetes bacterium]|nr:AMP-binding protein [Planctomycetota bacterium]
MTLTHKFLETCDKFGNNIAIIDDTGSLTYAEFGAAAKKMAALLTGLTPRQNIGILLPTCKEFSIAYFATLLMGKTPVPLNFLMSSAQMSYVIKDASLDTVITISLFRNLVEGQINHCVCLDEIKAPSPKSQESARTNKFVHATQLSRLVDSPADTAVLLYTSGTTANPKGVILTHKNILSVIDGVAPSFKFTHEDVILGVLPLFHSFALTVTLALPVCFGARVVYVTRFSGQRVLELIEKHKITIVAAIPSMFRVMLRTLGSKIERSETSSKYDLSSVRLYATGGEPLPKDITEGFSAISPIPLFEGYGLTEASAIVSVNLPDKYKAGTAGPPLPNLNVQIVDENHNPLPPNTDGEIWIKGPSVMSGYHNLPQHTAEALTKDGWLKTGDIGTLDADGFLKITGRKKELIIISGENVSPNEIEETIALHPEVYEVAVVGVPDKTRGEVPKAYISLAKDANLSENDLKDFCRDRLPHYKIPRYFEFRENLPKGPTGKILKRAL